MNSEAVGSIRGIVLAGAAPWDDTALDASLPRTLLPVAHAPLIGYVLQWLRAAGVDHVTVCANSASCLVRQCLGTGRHMGLELDYYEDWTPRGPAGCVRDAGLADPADVYVVADGTIVPRIDLGALLAAHRAAGAWVTVAVNGAASDGSACGPLQPVGIYVFQREALACIPATGYQDIKEILIPRLRQSGGRVVAELVDGCCPRVTGFESYLAVCEWTLEQLVSRTAPPPGFRRLGEALIHRRARVSGSAVLMGPVLLGPWAHVSDGATIVGPATLGARCNIWTGAVVCRSVLWDRAEIGPESVVDQCVISHDARVPTGAALHGRYLPAPHDWDKALRLDPHGELQLGRGAVVRASGGSARAEPGARVGGLRAGRAVATDAVACDVEGYQTVVGRRA